MSRILRSKPNLRAFAAGIGPVVCVGSLVVNRPTIRCDSPTVTTSRPSSGQRRLPPGDISPETIRQISGGSVAGFTSGLLVALFSRTLALLGGLLVFSFHVASRYGLDIFNMLGISKVVKKSSVLRRFKGRPWFTASFLVTFILAAFVQL